HKDIPMLPKDILMLHKVIPTLHKDILTLHKDILMLRKGFHMLPKVFLRLIHSKRLYFFSTPLQPKVTIQFTSLEFIRLC
ncbi:MAG TPA: hypothetical protein VK469_12025, partial [Candidatus Kapabacteria bacterium]|nr:hypothetical protein [Candidatus Kapabacteria bacterium]